MKIRKIIEYFRDTFIFYSKVTGYKFPIRPIFRLFTDHEEFLKYISRPVQYPSLFDANPEKYSSAVVRFFQNRIVIAMDLREEEYPGFMWPYKFFHEYEHIRRRFNEQGILTVVKIPEGMTEELEVIIAAVNLTEKFLDFRFPADVKKEMKKQLIEAHVQGRL